MDYLEDVLDGTGRTPREFGAVQVFVETVLRDEGGRTQVCVWLQAAFTPCRGSVLIDGRSFPFPDLSSGKVVRGTFSLDQSAPLVLVSADAKVTDASSRVRTPWKLLDTFAVSHQHHPGSTLGLGTALAVNIATLPLGVVVIPGRVATGGVVTNVDVIKARELGALECTASIVPTLAPLAAPRWEVMWTPGSPLPASHHGLQPVSPTSLSPEAAQSEAAGSSTSSPWQTAKELLGQGLSKREVEATLVSRCGLSAADARVLLQDVPDQSAPSVPDSPSSDISTESGLNLGSLLGVGMLLTGVVAIGLLNPVTAVLGLVLVVMGLIRVVETFGAWSEPARIDAATLQPPPADAPGNRCGQHPTLMSLGSCPRCGTWSCRACSP